MKLKEENIGGRNLSFHSKETILNILNAPTQQKQIAIEDFTEFDNNNLAEYKILYALLGKEWYWFYNILAVVSILIAVFPFFALLISKIPNFWWFSVCIPAITTIILLVRSYRKKLSPVVKVCNEVLKIKINPKYNIFQDKIIISKIQNRLFNDFVNVNYTKILPEQISKLVEALKFETSNTTYIYQSLTISISFLTLILASFLTSWFRITTDLNNFISIAVKCGILWIIISFTFFYFEDSFIKDIIRNKKNRYKRLIRVLENYDLSLSDNKTIM